MKLSSLEKNTLSNRSMDFLKGGDNDGSKSCKCSCYYRNQGGSSINENAKANWQIPTNSIHQTSDQVEVVQDKDGVIREFWTWDAV